jgi:hypothetical protein
VKTPAVVVLIGSLALASPAVANQIQVGYSGSSYGPYQTGIGGEFTLNDIDGTPANNWLDISDYSPLAKNQGNGTISSFQTFCIEKNEYIYPYNAIYDVTISGGSVHGGVGGPGDPDPVSKGTAFLYSQFARGLWSDYNYGSGRSGSAAALQEAIWWLEEEISSYGSSNHFIDLVTTQFGSPLAGREDAFAGEFGVYALNLTGVSNAPATVGQDQLYYNAVPDGGSTVSLLVMALCAAGVVANRFRNA